MRSLALQCCDDVAIKETQTVVLCGGYGLKTNLEQKTVADNHTFFPELRKSPKIHFKYSQRSKGLFDFPVDMVAAILKLFELRLMFVFPWLFGRHLKYSYLIKT